MWILAKKEPKGKKSASWKTLDVIRLSYHNRGLRAAIAASPLWSTTTIMASPLWSATVIARIS